MLLATACAGAQGIPGTAKPERRSTMARRAALTRGQPCCRDAASFARHLCLLAVVWVTAAAAQAAAECVNDILYDYVSISELANNITDAKLRPELCPDKPFYGEQPAEHTRGAPHIPDTFKFDSALSSDERIEQFQAIIDEPHMVEISDLSDEEIAASCLTVEDCRLPPALTIVRKKSNGAFWQPYVQKSSYKYKDMFGHWCCDVNELMDDFSYDQRNTNTKTILKSFPAISSQFRSGATLSNVTFFPSTATTAAEAKIIRIDFRAESTDLYFYVDNTCNHLKGQRWQNGFMGNAARAGGGFFHEVIFKSYNTALPSAHNPASQANGPVPKNTDKFTVQYIGNLKPGSRRFQWVSVKNLWFIAKVQDKNPAGYRRMASVHLKTAMEWLLLAPPRGNLAVALMYLFAAKLYLDKAGGTNPYAAHRFDFSLIEEYQGSFYENYESAVDHLMTQNEDSQMVRIFHALMELDGFASCLEAVPPSFYKQFSHTNQGARRPPEAGCLGAAEPIFDCTRWHSRRCANTYKVLYEARATMWKSFHESVPQCGSCPGLIGWWRSGVTSSSHEKLLEIGRYPQCLPWRDTDGTDVDNFGYDMYTTNAYELDYNEGYLCGPLYCRFADALYVPLEQVTESVTGQICADTSPLKTVSLSTLDACRQKCYALTLNDDFACTSFSYNAATEKCKLYQRCSVLTTEGASSDDVMYVAKPKMYDPTRSWSDPADFYSRADTLAPTTLAPTPSPTGHPTMFPTDVPTMFPTMSPTDEPTRFPTPSPSPAPTNHPTLTPTLSPTDSPTDAPTTFPTPSPTDAPTTFPTPSPTLSPTPPTNAPTRSPAYVPTVAPTDSPTIAPTPAPTMAPTESPTKFPTLAPTDSPTIFPTLAPTNSPTMAPTNSPTLAPTNSPTMAPTDSPTSAPTDRPTLTPTESPTLSPTESPTLEDPLRCASDGVRYKGGRRIRRRSKVQSAEECHAICMNYSNCRGFSWYQPTSVCNLMDRSYYERSDKRFISGPRSCPQSSECEQQFYENRGRKLVKIWKIDSAEICAKECNRRSTCKAWVYETFRRRCVLLKTVRYKKTRTAYYITGTKSACADYGTST